MERIEFCNANTKYWQLEMASKVDDWAACDLRYVGENKLARLYDCLLYTSDAADE